MVKSAGCGADELDLNIGVTIFYLCELGSINLSESCILDFSSAKQSVLGFS